MKRILWMSEQEKTPRYWLLARIDGADGRDRTCDLLVTNELLYQLSYIGTLLGELYAKR